MANGKLNRRKTRPEIVTGDFELHFEEVVNRNRYSLVALLTGGLLVLTLLVPGVVYYSQADVGNVLIEAEDGNQINKGNIRQIKDEETGLIYIEFTSPTER